VRKPRLTSRGAQKLGERERVLGLDPEDEASRGLEKHEPKREPKPSKSATKSKAFHRWRRRQQQR
jgi:hypothetical protein